MEKLGFLENKKKINAKIDEVNSKISEIEIKERELESLKNELADKENSLNKIDSAIKQRENNVRQGEDELTKKKSDFETNLIKIEYERKQNIENECAAIRDERKAECDNYLKTQMEKLENERKIEDVANKEEIKRLREEIENLKNQLLGEQSSGRAKDTEITGKNDEISKLNSTIDEKNQKINDIKTELLNERKLKENEINEKNNYINECGQLKEQIKVKQDEIESYKTLKDTIGNHTIEEVMEKIRSFYNWEQDLIQKQKELDDNIQNYHFDKDILEENKKSLAEKENNIDVAVEERVKNIENETIRELQIDNEEQAKRIDTLSNDLRSKESLSNKFDDIKAMFGDKNPLEVMEEHREFLDEFKETVEKANEASSIKHQMENDALRRDREELAQQVEEFRDKENDYNNTKTENAQLQCSINQKDSEINELKKHNSFLEDENSRLTAAYETPENRDARIEDIEENPYIEKENIIRSDNFSADIATIDEKQWLTGIRNGISDYGIKFADRLLLSFHTALKTAEMSPLTVLAGVSGTGKSLLPRLYSHFGGINFISVPVAPNWDCQEAMLGFYNSIDNYFDAQPVLRFLAQTQRSHFDKEGKETDGLRDVMNMILLDEMNLANVELYFSEFLSKLEERRDYEEGNAKFPKLGVKIGAKMKEWQLPLGRNVLWTGTMNQDETTKTLSDKVLDRGIVLNFPTPEELKSRIDYKPLPAAATLLSRADWKEWQKTAADEKIIEALNDYKEKIDDINKKLGKAGRALGHRVWQSVESYMLLHPEVRYAIDDDKKKEALDRAFEDQLVQKVMPKLRGLETRGIQGEALDGIENIIKDYELGDDFAQAKEQGYGQFMWCSSNYINKSPDSPLFEVVKDESEGENEENDNVVELKDQITGEDADEPDEDDSYDDDGYDDALDEDDYESDDDEDDESVEDSDDEEIDDFDYSKYEEVAKAIKEKLLKTKTNPKDFMKIWLFKKADVLNIDETTIEKIINHCKGIFGEE